MATTNQVKVVISAEDTTKKGIKSAEKNMSSLGSTAMKLGSILAGAFAVGAIVNFGKKAVAAAVDAERSQRQLEHAIIAVSKGTMEQVQAIDQLSGSLQKKAGIDGDALKAGAAQLSTFGLQSESVVNLTKSLADLTVNQNGVNASADQYIASANNIAKALNGQFGILEKSGIRFTEAQQSMILYGTEAEKVTALQEGLNQNLRETTDTIGNSTEGAMARLSQAMGEITESVGAALLPILAKVAEALVPVAEAFQQWVESISTLGGLKGLVDQLKTALFDLLETIDSKTGLISLFKQSFQNVSDVIQYNLWPAIQKLWEALKPFQPFMEALVTVFGTMFVIALGAAIKAIEYFIILTATWIQSIVDTAAAVTNFLNPVFDWLGDKIAAVTEKVIKLIDKFKQLDVLGGLKSSVSKIFGGGRAVGGPVTGGRPYLVGENGPEIFTPQGYGRITKNSDMGGAGINITLQGNTFMGREGIAEQIAADLVRQLGRSTKLSY